MKKRLLISTITFSKKGGIERYNVELIHYLSQFYEIDVICQGYEEELIINENINPIVIKFPENRYIALLSSFKFMDITKKFIEENKHRYFRVISSGLWLGYQDFFIAHSCHKGRVKFMFSQSPFTKTIYDPSNLLINKIEKRGYSLDNFGKVIVVSKFVAEQIKKQYNLTDERVIPFHSGVNVSEFGVDEDQKSKINEEIRSKYNINKDEIVLLFVAHEFKRKGFDLILDGLNLLKKSGVTNFKLFVIGKDSPDKFIADIEKYNLKDNIIFTGLIGNELRKYYFASDIFLFPTRHDPFPLVVMEAMAAGLPIIISKTCGNSEIIENYKDGVVLENLDGENIYKELKNLFENTNLRLSIGSNAKDKIYSSYTWDIRFALMKDIIEKGV